MQIAQVRRSALLQPRSELPRRTNTVAHSHRERVPRCARARLAFLVPLARLCREMNRLVLSIPAVALAAMAALAACDEFGPPDCSDPKNRVKVAGYLEDVEVPQDGGSVYYFEKVDAAPLPADAGTDGCGGSCLDPDYLRACESRTTDAGKTIVRCEYSAHEECPL
jgi:hypothetical protein